MVTAVAHGGRRAVVGTMRGRCRFYGAAQRGALEYEAQLDVKVGAGSGLGVGGVGWVSVSV
jgi:hypothetical protein